MSLRDPIWEFISVALALIAIFITFYQHKKKSLSYGVIRSTAILSIKEEIKDKIQIFFDGSPVQGVHLVMLQIINDGNVPIGAHDFERPLNFSFDKNSVVLNLEIVEPNPRTLCPNIRIV